MLKRFLILTVCIAVMAGCEAQDEELREHEHALDVSYPANAVEGLPFSDAVRAGNMLYLSGSIGVLPGTLELAEGGLAGETRQSLENIRTTLVKYGSSMEEIVKCTIMMDDIAEWSDMNEVYVTYFPNHKPARSAFGADGLALGARVEIECIATVK